MQISADYSVRAHSPSRIRPSLLMTLTVIWFLCAFAPAVCIVHCQILDRPAARTAPSVAALASFNRLSLQRTWGNLGAAAVDVACAFIAPQPVDPAGLPPISSLPHITSDLMPATILGLMLIFSIKPLIRIPPAAYPPLATLPRTPPPKRHQLALSIAHP
jgi:hypothetical protein